MLDRCRLRSARRRPRRRPCQTGRTPRRTRSRRHNPLPSPADLLALAPPSKASLVLDLSGLSTDEKLDYLRRLPARSAPNVAATALRTGVDESREEICREHRNRATRHGRTRPVHGDMAARQPARQPPTRHRRHHHRNHAGGERPSRHVASICAAALGPRMASDVAAPGRRETSSRAPRRTTRTARPSVANTARGSRR